MLDSGPVRMDPAFDGEDWSVFDVGSIPDSQLTWSKTVCPYCGVGCGLSVGHKENSLHKIRGNPEHPANRGLLCAKGATLAQVVDAPDRLRGPLGRRSRGDAFSPISWNEAVLRAAEAVRSTVDRHGPDAFAFYISGQLHTEDYYVVNKFAKACLGTNNVDSNSRLCMASAVAGYVTSLGADGPPACYEDIELADCFLLIGTNTAACHPVVFQRIKIRKTKNPDARVVVVDPRRTATADLADLYVPLRPGTDVAFLNGVLHALEKEGFVDRGFIDFHTEGWEDLRRLIAGFTPEETARICGIPASDVVETARLFGRSKAALSFYSMGFNQSTAGTAKNNAVINLHLACGKIGKPGSGPFSLTGQPNAMGGRETGGLSHLLPGHRFIADAAHRGEMERFWGLPAGRISPRPGLTAVELFDAARAGKIKTLWVLATNPAVSMPDGARALEALRRVDCLIVQDAYHPTETTSRADLVLPAAQWSERDGTMTNSERRVSYAAKLIDPPGEARPDWRIVSDVARRLGFAEEFPFEAAEQVFEEYKLSTRGTGMDLSGMSYERLRRAPLQWPCASPDAPGTPRLYTDGRFPSTDGRARFRAHPYRPPAEMPDAEFPMELTTGRVRDQWHTMTRTGKVDALLRSDPYAFVEIHPRDAARLGIAEGDLAEVVTRRGRARAPARLTDRIRPGLCFMPFHWGDLFGEAVTNRATISAFDPVSKQPELKYCACRIERVNERVRVNVKES